MTKNEIASVVRAFKRYMEDYEDWKKHSSELIANRLIRLYNI